METLLSEHSFNLQKKYGIFVHNKSYIDCHIFATDNS